MTWSERMRPVAGRGALLNHDVIGVVLHTGHPKYALLVQGFEPVVIDIGAVQLSFAVLMELAMISCCTLNSCDSAT